MSTLNVTSVQTFDVRSTGINGLGGNPPANSAFTINQNNIVSSFLSNPYFFGTRSAGAVWENFGTTPVVYVYNQRDSPSDNSTYNTTTGIFTCSLAGVYLICPSALFGQLGGDSNLYVYKNGVNVTARGVHSNTNGNNLWHTNSYTFAIDCAVNDQLTVRIRTSNANVYGDKYSFLSIWYYG
jgi:hypothetical protein